MPRSQRTANLIAVITPFVAFVAAMVLFWGRFVDDRPDRLCVMYVIAGLGITVGFHRMLTHRAFPTRSSASRYVFAGPGRWPCRGR